MSRPSEIDGLRERVAELEALLGARDVTMFPAKLSPALRDILGLLLARASADKTQIATMLWGGLPECDWPARPNKVIGVHIWRLRRALAPFGIAVGGGRSPARYFFTPAAKAVIRALLAPSEAA